MSDARLIDPLECRVHDPSVAEWTEVKAACERLGIETKRMYNWVYTKKVQGCKKEGGRLLIPRHEMTRLMEMVKAGTLDAVMWKQAQRFGLRVYLT